MTAKIFGTLFFSIFSSILFWRIYEKNEPSPTDTNVSYIYTYIFNIGGLCFFTGTGMIFSALGPLVTLCKFLRYLKFLSKEKYF